MIDWLSFFFGVVSLFAFWQLVICPYLRRWERRQTKMTGREFENHSPTSSDKGIAVGLEVTVLEKPNTDTVEGTATYVLLAEITTKVRSKAVPIACLEKGIMDGIHNGVVSSVLETEKQ